jgi:DNA invertase Pin-like site-specific DNA recombinase
MWGIRTTPRWRPALWLCRKPKLNARQAATVRRMYQASARTANGSTVAEIAEAVGVHRTTVYDYLKKER